MPATIRRRSLQRPGRVVPAGAARLRGRVVTLRPGGLMPWHSTERREELLIGLTGTVRVVTERAGRRRSVVVEAGACVFLPQDTPHCVVNATRRAARYLYVTGG